jgi:hypothetical protein
MNDVKQRGSKTFISSREELIASDRPALYSRRRTPAKIIRFFGNPDGDYAGASAMWLYQRQPY